MNTLRLVFGWLFLAGLTAAGTYYALDEIDQRGGLAGIDLHQKVGVVRYAAARAPLQNQTPPANHIAQPSGSQTPPSGNATPPANNLIQPSNNIAPPYQQTTRSQAPPSQTQGPYRTPPPPFNQTQPPDSNSNPPYGNPRNSQSPPPNRGQTPQTQLPPDYVYTQSRLVRVMNRANGMSRQYNMIRQNLVRQNLNLRPEQQAALVAMAQFTQIAQRALRSGDTATSRQFMDEAEKQMDILEKLRDQ